MAKEKTGKISSTVNLLLLSWFILTPVFWHLNTSEGIYGSYDVFFMAPYSVFHLVIFYALGVISVYLSKLSLYHVLLFGLYFPFIQLSNYPYLTIRDAYLHAGPAKTILVNGQLTTKDPTPESWPSSFFLHGILTIVSGCDLINANYILYLSLIIALVLISYSFARILEKKNYRLAWASPLLFLCLFFNHLFDNFHHYARTPLAFAFLFFFFFSLMGLEDRCSAHTRLTLQLLICVSVVITHPFQSLALIAFMFAYWILSRKIKPINFALFSIVTFIAWIMFQGSSNFLEAINRLKTFFSPQYLTPIVETLATKETLPWWGVILRDYYKYSLLALLAIAFFATIVVLRRKRITAIAVGLSSLLFSSVVMLFSLLLLPDWQIGRFTPFAAFPAAFTSLILLEEALKKGNLKILSLTRNLFRKRYTSATLLLFVVSLSATVMVLRFERNYYFGEMCHPSELSSLAFFFTHDHNSTVNIVSWRTYSYSPYFDYNSSHQLLRIWYLELNEYAGNSSKLLFSQSQLINQSQFVIRGLRDSFTSGQLYPSEAILKVVDEEMIIPRFDLIYSNGYYWIYKRAVSP